MLYFQLGHWRVAGDQGQEVSFDLEALEGADFMDFSTDGSAVAGKHLQQPNYKDNPASATYYLQTVRLVK